MLSLRRFTNAFFKNPSIALALTKALIYEVLQSRKKIVLRKESKLYLKSNNSPCPRIRPHFESYHVIFFLPWLTGIGGAEKFIRDLGSGLKEGGFRVSFIGTEKLPKGYEETVADFQIISDSVTPISRMTQYEKLNFVFSLMDDERSNAVIVNSGSPWLYSAMPAIRDRYLEDIRIIDLHFNDTGHVYELIRRQSYIDCAIAAHINLARTLSQFAAKDFVVKTLNTGITPPKVEGLLRENLSTVGWLGRMSEEKRPDRFIDIARELQGLDIKFLMAGSGPMEKEIESRSHALQNLSFLGFVDDLESFFNCIDLLILTSDVEGISISAMQAISYGIPVMSPAVGGMPDLISDKKNGILIPENRVECYAESLTQLFRDKQRYLSLSLSTHSTKLPNQFRHETTLKEFQHLIEDLVN